MSGFSARGKGFANGLNLKTPEGRREYQRRTREAAGAKPRAPYKKRDGLQKKDSRAYGRLYYAENREKMAAKCRAWRAKNREKSRLIIRRSAIKRVHGMTIEEYRLRSVQHDACPVCLRTDYRLVADHNHDTGAHRGFICCNCNAALGMAGDNPKILRKLAKYLEKHNDADVRTSEKIRDGQGGAGERGVGLHADIPRSVQKLAS